MKSKAFEKFNELDDVFDVYSGGAVEWKNVARMEKIKPKDSVIFHSKKFYEEGYERTVLIAIVERKTKVS